MRGICFCIGDTRELGNLIGDIKMIHQRGMTPLIILDDGMGKPSYLEDCAVIHTDINRDMPIGQNWEIDLLVVTHRSIIGRYLVEYWDRPQVKFLYQGLYAPTQEWLKLHTHIHTVWGLTAVCVQGFERLDPWVVDAVKFGEQLGPGRRLLELMDA